MITVAELLAHADLDLTLLAGTAGQDRLITWAHAVDLPDPWRWVHPGDLMMTTGAGIPAETDSQVAWMEEVVRSRASGLVHAPGPNSPTLSSEALTVAETSRFPVLGAGFDLEFTALARLVIESVLDSQRHRLARTERLFAAYAASLREGGSMTDRLQLLGHRFGWNLEIDRHQVDPPTATGGSTLAMAIPGRLPATVRVRPVDEDNLDSVADPLLVNYLVGLLGIELEREAIDRDQLRGIGETLWQRILNGTVDFTTASDALAQRGLVAPLVTVAMQPTGTAAWDPSQVHHLPALGGMHPLFLDSDTELLALLPEEGEVPEIVRSAVGVDTPAGVSAPVNATTGLIESVRQARLALAQARDAGELLVRYAATRATTLLPDTISECRALAMRHLGPVIEHDAVHGTELVATIQAFLAADGSWKQTAERLHIHRQTLVYRLKTVEQLTGLKPNSTVGTTSFWLALEAGRAVGLLD